MTVIGLVLGILIGALIDGFIIWIVGKLRWGLEVSGFGPAFLAAIMIAVINGLVAWLFSMLGIHLAAGLVPAIVNLVVSALILMVAGRFVKGFVVKGFGGALVAAVAVSVVGWLLFWGLSLLA